MATQTGMCPIDQGALYYEVAGDGPAVVLIHAGVADLRMWDAVFPAFAARFRTVRFDMRSFGRTTTTATTGISMRADLVALLDHLGMDRAALVGVSMGGGLVVDAALEFPDRVAAIVPICPSLSGFNGSMSAAETALETQIEHALTARDFAALPELETQLWGDGPGQPVGRMAPGPRALMLEMIADNYRLHPDEITTVSLKPPAAGRLGEIRCPTLVVLGEFDTEWSASAGQAIAAGVPGAQHAVMPGVAHLPPLEQPEAFAGLVLPFLAASLGSGDR